MPYSALVPTRRNARRVVKTTVLLEVPLWEAAKLYAVAQRTSLGGVVRAALAAFLPNLKGEKKS